MISVFKKQLRSKYYTHGSNWQFDWYIDELFCYAMAYGKNPIYLGYSQPIVGDEFLTFSGDQQVIDRYKNFFEDSQRVNKLISSQNKIVSSATALIDKIKKDHIINLSKYKKTQSDLSLLMASVSVVFDKIIEVELKRIAANQKIPYFTLSSIVIDRSSITKLNESNQLLIKLHNTNHKILAKNLRQHAISYGWINTGERGKKPWTAADFNKQLRTLINKQSPKATTVPRLSAHNQLVLDRIIKINQNDNIASDLQVELDYLFQKFLQDRLQGHYDEKIIEQLTFGEIRQILVKPKLISKYHQRVGNFNRTLFPHHKAVNSTYLEPAKFKALKSLIATPVPNNFSIAGSVACRGNVTGVVRLITKYSDFKSFQKGEIIVANQTQPSYTPYMTQASAIVTDVGGITSHAAIISREFNIPCIVGTLNATKILKTGDKVFVDTNNGIVRKVI